MKNGYFGLICWIFGIVAVVALAWGAYILIDDNFSFGSNEETAEESGQIDSGSSDAFYIDINQNNLLTF